LDLRFVRKKEKRWKPQEWEWALGYEGAPPWGTTGSNLMGEEEVRSWGGERENIEKKKGGGRTSTPETGSYKCKKAPCGA